MEGEGRREKGRGGKGKRKVNFSRIMKMVSLSLVNLSDEGRETKRRKRAGRKGKRGGLKRTGQSWKEDGIDQQ